MFAILDRGDASTVEKSMEKRGEISPAKPNAATRSDVERVMKRAEALGVTFEEAVYGAGFERATYYRFKKFAASVASLRTVEEWIVKEEARRRLPPVPTADQQSELLHEWQQLGAGLLDADPKRFAEILDGLRDVLGAARLQQSAYSKMFRATPEPTR